MSSLSPNQVDVDLNVKGFKPVKSLVQFFVTAAVLLSLASLVACGNQAFGNQSVSTSSLQTASSSPTASSGSPTAKASAKATKIDVSETEMAIKLTPATVPAGLVEFVIHNNGAVPHEFVVFKTNLALNQLPMKDSKLDEDSKSLQNVADSGAHKLTSGESKTLQANLTPGNYAAICNVGNHFHRGMKTKLTVK